MSHKKIFVNLPVKDLEKSKEFYTKIGFTINPQFSDETAACVVISEEIYVMILTYEKFQKFTNKEIIDAKSSIEVLNSLSLDSKQEVDEMSQKAVNAGGKKVREEDLGFMYTQAIEDLDGHVWELFYMDLSKAPATPQGMKVI